MMRSDVSLFMDDEVEVEVFDGKTSWVNFTTVPDRIEFTIHASLERQREIVERWRNALDLHGRTTQ